ncbi:DNA translocase FtsK [Ligilactobacillus sp. LYQ60]|uniref:DNA translocase FtsK n=1 Tax=unclassified Ligilactobacillus TaxID=2767920 RepID=UPI0038621B73
MRMEHYDGPAFLKQEKQAHTRKRRSASRSGQFSRAPRTQFQGQEYHRHAFRPKYVPPAQSRTKMTEESPEQLVERMMADKENYFLFGEREAADERLPLLTGRSTKSAVKEAVVHPESEVQESLPPVQEQARLAHQHLRPRTSEKITSVGDAATQKEESYQHRAHGRLHPQQVRRLSQTLGTASDLDYDGPAITRKEAAQSSTDNHDGSAITRQKKSNGTATSDRNTVSQVSEAPAGHLDSELLDSDISSKLTPKQVGKPLDDDSLNTVTVQEVSNGTEEPADIPYFKPAPEEPSSRMEMTDDSAKASTNFENPANVSDVQPSVSHNPAVQTKTTVSIQGYEYPRPELLPDPVLEGDPSMDEWVMHQIDVLNETLQAFHVDANVSDWTVGPTVTQFEVTLGRGVRVNKIANLADDLKLALAAKDIRIEAPIPGKSSVGVEIPNKHSRPVLLSEVLRSQKFQEADSPLTVALGVDLFGQPQITDLKKMPHGLIAGATGSGKSVFINSMLISLLYKANPAEVKLLLIDPKAVEMAPYHDIPHLLAPVISDPQAAAAALQWAVNEMEERYQRLAASGTRNIEAFNAKAETQGKFGLKMPYIVIVIDELADLMMVASSEVQDYIARITQKARAAGIHLIIATQRPSVDVVTGTIKNNIPTRIAFMVSSQVDSRTILDSAGAERLLGRGDMLYLGNGASQPMRLQGTFVENEIDAITDFVRQQGKPQYAFDPEGLKSAVNESAVHDELFPRVLEYLVNEDTISTSKLQRVFSIGYNRAANIVDDLEKERYVSPAHGSKPRDVYVTEETVAERAND